MRGRVGVDFLQYVFICLLLMLVLHIKLKSMSTNENTDISGIDFQSIHIKSRDLSENKPTVADPQSNELHQDQHKVSDILPAVPLKVGSNVVSVTVQRDMFQEEPSLQGIPHPEVQQENCTALLYDTSNKRVREMALFRTEDNPHIPVDTVSFTIKRGRCEEFKQNRKYIMEVTEEERDFPIAFSIVVFKDIEQIERLLRMIYRPHNYYCIHVDSKAPAKFFLALRSLAMCFKNVILASKRSDVRWGMFTVLEPELTCMKDLSQWKWKYFINLTGQEFPLKTNYQLVKILTVYQGANDVEALIKRRNKNRTKYVYSEKGKKTDVKKSPPPANMTLIKGAVHVTLSRGFVDYTLNNRVALQFTDWLRDSSVPDETMFASLNRNPQLAIPGAYLGTEETHNVTNPFMSRFKVWRKQAPCAGKWQRSVCVLSAGDIWMLPNRPELFVNKFAWDYQTLAYECMEEWYFNMVLEEKRGKRDFDTTVYEKIPWVRNHV